MSNFSTKKKFLSLAVGTTLALGISPVAFANSASVDSARGESVAQSSSYYFGLSRSDLNEIASKARIAGDTTGANAVSQYANGKHSRNIVSSVAKKALITVLRYGQHKLPAKIRPYAGKIINVIETVNDFQRGALTNALMAAGIPYDVADAAAYWCVVFLGI